MLFRSLHIQSIDHNEAIKTIKRKITDLDRMKIEEQKKAIRSGYDMDIIPSDLATYGGEAKNLLRDLQSRNERMFLLILDELVCVLKSIALEKDSIVNCDETWCKVRKYDHYKKCYIWTSKS